MTNPRLQRLEGVSACVFDAYGTLFDFASAAARCDDIPVEKRAALTTLWRDKQLQYTWLRSLQNRYADFWQVTGEALDFALESLALAAPALRERLMELYLGLEPFPEVPEVLRTLRARGFKTAILSNGSPAMLEPLVRRSGLADAFDAVLSVDAVGVFKTHPRSLPARARRPPPAGAGGRLPVLQRLGRPWGVGFRNARRLVQPLRAAPRAPARRAGLRDPFARGAAGAAARDRLSGGRLLAGHCAGLAVIPLASGPARRQ